MHYYETKIYQSLRHLYFKYIRIPYAYRQTSRLHILNSIDSIKYIIEHHCSVSRYGDGEFFVMGGKGNGFQSPNPRLADMLKKVITSKCTNHVVGIPYTMKNVSNLADYPRFFWTHLTGKYFRFFNSFLSTEKQYISSQFTRFYIDYKDKSHCAEQVALIKKIWEKRDIVLIEGIETRSGVGNDLYDNAKSIQRILGPATNAMDLYDEMLKAIIQNVTKDKMILLSYGMVATVLAYDLAKLGYWAIDMGHIDIEYEWYKLGVTEKVAIEGKFTNEANKGNKVKECTDSQYLSQIICDITKQ